MLRYFFVLFIAATLLILSVAGFRGMKSSRPPLQIFPDMDDQPKFRPQHGTGFFADGRAARPPIPGTVPIGYNLPGIYDSTAASNSRAVERAAGFSAEPNYLDTGIIEGNFGDGIPLQVTAALLQRGRERFAINCAVCHGAMGDGNGIIKQYGLTTIATLQDERIRAMPDGEIFHTITHGKNTMGAYGHNIAVEDRWAIVTYLRALQRSQAALAGDLSEQDRAQLEQSAAAIAAPQGGNAQ